MDDPLEERSLDEGLVGGPVTMMPMDDDDVDVRPDDAVVVDDGVEEESGRTCPAAVERKFRG